MIKLLKYWLLNRVIKNPTLSAEVYQMMYNGRLFVRPANENIIQQPSLQFFDNNLSSVAVPSQQDKRRELMIALGELKGKTIKTKQDKESIGILEAALKNVN